MRPVKADEAGWSPAGVLRGTLSGLLVTLVLLCLLAVAMLWVDLDDRPARILMDAAGAVGALAAGFAAGRRAEVRGLVHGGMAGLLFGLVVLLVGLGFFDVGLAPWAWLVRLAVSTLLGAVGGIVGVNF